MKFRFVFAIMFLIFGCACQSYSLRASSEYGIEKIKNAKINIVSMQEAESNPDESDTKFLIPFEEIKNELKASQIKSALLKAFNKILGSNEKDARKEIFVSAKINRRVICSRGGSMFAYSRLYNQYGDVILDLTGRFKDGSTAFAVSVAYDMGKIQGSSLKSFACDSYDKITKKINENIIPLAVEYVGQNILVDK